MDVSKIGGISGKLLFVDLTTNEIKEEATSNEMASLFLGGYGMGGKILFDRMKKDADPLGPDNILGFVPGLLNGTGTYMSGRYMVVCKSPITGGFNDANSGGFFGTELKKAGYDGVYVSGKAEKPVYLWINDGKVEIKDAADLWGMNSKEVLSALKIKTGDDKIRAAVIGPAGENLALISSIMNDGHRAAARGGLGAVMGSKNLKALVVRGTGTVHIHDKEAFSAINKEIMQSIKTPPETPMGQYVNAFKALGTAATTTPSILSGDAPVKNWSGIGVKDFTEVSADMVGAQSYDHKYFQKKYACQSCTLACGASFNANSEKWDLYETERPEYETAVAFGSNCMNTDVEAMLKCNEICNTYGIDTISTGSVVAWTMECFDKGFLGKNDLGGIDATWGSAEAMVALTEMIAKSEGIGKILGLGQAKAAEKLGFGKEFLTTAFGIELGMHDPRLSQGWARPYQYDPTPGRHTKGGASNLPLDIPNRAVIDAGACSLFEVLSAAGLCQFTMFAYPEHAMDRMIEAVTGIKFDQQTSYLTGIRILNIRHAFNMREGLRRKDFTISPRVVGKPPFEEGPTAGVTVPNEKLGDDFFGVVGWDLETGMPVKEQLVQLGGMESVIKDLYGK